MRCVTYYQFIIGLHDTELHAVVQLENVKKSSQSPNHLRYNRATVTWATTVIF